MLLSIDWNVSSGETESDAAVFSVVVVVLEDNVVVKPEKRTAWLSRRESDLRGVSPKLNLYK